MAKYNATIHWEKHQDQQESYTWTFDNGVVLHNAHQATIANHGMVDPESAFVASVASCHMLSLLALAAKQGIFIKRYHDEAIGILEKNNDGRIAITRVLLRPAVDFHDASFSEDAAASLHDQAHRNCFIANSIKTTVHIEPQSSTAF